MSKFSHTWIIDNFSIRCDQLLIETPSLESNKFSTSTGQERNEIYLRLYPRGFDRNSEGYLSLFFYLTQGPLERVTFLCKISILNSNEDKCFTREEKGIISLNVKRGWEKFIRLDHLHAREMLQDDKLRIFCELGIVGEPTTINSDNISTSDNLQINNFAILDDFGRLFQDRSLCDVEFVVQGKSISAHKTVLAARSAVFMTMFTVDMKEAKENRVEVTDVTPKVFSDLLRCIYTGRYELEPEAVTCEHVTGLFVAADKYELKELKRLCENSLSSMVNSETVEDLLILTSLHNPAKLKKTLFDFINFQEYDIMEDSEVIGKISKNIVLELWRHLKNR